MRTLPQALAPASLLLAASAAAGVTVGTGDGFGLDLDPATGAVQAVLLDGLDHRDASVYGGLFVRDRERLLDVPPSWPNLVANASFEVDSEPDGMPDGWSFADAWGTGATMTYGTDALDGSRSVSVNGRAGGTLAAYDIAVVPGQRYRLQAMAKGAATTAVYVVWKRADGTFLIYEPGAILRPSAGWAPVHLITTAPEGAELADVALVAVSDGGATFDRVRLDRATPEAFSPVAGPVAAAPGGGAAQQAALPALGLDVAAEYRALADRLEVDVTLTDTTGRDRAIEAGFVLPVAPTRFWDSPLSSRVVTQQFYSEVFAWTWWGRVYNDGHFGRDRSVYPLAAVEVGPRTHLALALDVRDGPRDAQLFHSTHVGESFTALVRLGLAAEPQRFPRQARFRLLLFRALGEQGFRAALDRYYLATAPVFESAHRGAAGWLPWRSPASVPGFRDFGLAVHSWDGDPATDEAAGVRTLGYLPSLDVWLPLGDFAARPSVQDALDRLDFNATDPGVAAGLQQEARSVHVSGCRDAAGGRVLEVYQASWMPGSGWSAVFAIDPDPEVADPAPRSWPSRWASVRAALDASFARAQAAAAPLDGAFLDWYRSWHDEAFNHERAHLATCDTPASFDPQALRPALPEGFAHWEAAQSLAADMRGRGLLTMARSVHVPSFWATTAFDLLGEEVRWSAAAEDDEETLAYFRAVAGRKPYALLLDADFGAYDVGHALRRALLHAFHLAPNWHDGLGAEYWSDAARVEADRLLFRRMTRLVALESDAGWQPATHASASDPALRLERYGDAAAGPLLVAAWNASASPVAATVAFDLAALGIPPQEAGAVVDLVEAGRLDASVVGGRLEARDALAPDAARLYHVHRRRAAGELVLRAVRRGGDVELSWTDAGSPLYDVLASPARELRPAAVELAGAPAFTDPGAVAAGGTRFYAVE